METDNDPVLSKIKRLLRDHEQDPSDKALSRYNNIWTELTVAEGVWLGDTG